MTKWKAVKNSFEVKGEATMMVTGTWNCDMMRGV